MGYMNMYLTFKKIIFILTSLKKLIAMIEQQFQWQSLAYQLKTQPTSARTINPYTLWIEIMNEIWIKNGRVISITYSALSVFSSSRSATHVEGVAVELLQRKRSLSPWAYLYWPQVDCKMLPSHPPSWPPTLLRDNWNTSSHYYLPWGMPPLL